VSNSTDGTQSDCDLSRSDARILRILTALAISIAQRREVTAVVSSNPRAQAQSSQLPGTIEATSGQVQVIAAHQSLAIHETAPTPPISESMLTKILNMFTMRNPHSDHERRVLGVGSHYEILTPTAGIDLDNTFENLQSL
jgi:hypothetical protein